MRDRIIIFGGGLAGVSVGEKLREEGFEGNGFEALRQALRGTSYAHARRLGIGSHYKNLPTAKYMMENSISFYRRYPDYVEESSIGTVYHLLEGEGFDSVRDYEAYITELEAHYAKLVTQDKENAIFGPGPLFKRLPVSPGEVVMIPDPEDPANPAKVKPKKIMARYSALEKVIRWDELREKLINDIPKTGPNFQFYYNTKVLRYKRTFTTDNKPLFTVRVKNTVTGEEQDIEGTMIVNCSWYDIERLNNTADFHPPEDQRTNRTKAMLEIELSEELLEKLIDRYALLFKGIEGAPTRKQLLQSLFGELFCYGPHAGITLIGRDLTTGKMRALVNYEPGTNIENNTGLEAKDLSAKLLSHTATKKEEKPIEDKILAGAAYYFPGLEQATVIGIRSGNVRVEGNAPVDVFNQNSPHHVRIEDGLSSGALGLINFPLVKLTAIAHSIDKFWQLFKIHLSTIQQDGMSKIRNAAEMAIKAIPVLQGSKISKDISRAIHNHFERTVVNDLHRSIKPKTLLSSATAATHEVKSVSEVQKLQESWLKTMKDSVQAKANVMAQLIKSTRKASDVSEADSTNLRCGSLSSDKSAGLIDPSRPLGDDSDVTMSVSASDASSQTSSGCPSPIIPSAVSSCVDSPRGSFDLELPASVPDDSLINLVSMTTRPTLSLVPSETLASDIVMQPPLAASLPKRKVAGGKEESTPAPSSQAIFSQTVSNSSNFADSSIVFDSNNTQEVQIKRHKGNLQVSTNMPSYVSSEVSPSSVFSQLSVSASQGSQRASYFFEPKPNSLRPQKVISSSSSSSEILTQLHQNQQPVKKTQNNDTIKPSSATESAATQAEKILLMYNQQQLIISQAADILSKYNKRQHLISQAQEVLRMFKSCSTQAAQGMSESFFSSAGGRQKSFLSAIR